jgi:hypothetical protein
LVELPLENHPFCYYYNYKCLYIYTHHPYIQTAMTLSMDEEQGIQLKNPYALSRSIRSIGAKEEGAASTAQKVGGFFVRNWRALFSVSILILIIVTIYDAVEPNVCVCPGGVPSEDVKCLDNDKNCNTCSKDGATSCKSCVDVYAEVNDEFQCAPRDCGKHCINGHAMHSCTAEDMNNREPPNFVPQLHQHLAQSWQSPCDGCNAGYTLIGVNCKMHAATAATAAEHAANVTAATAATATAAAALAAIEAAGAPISVN